MNRFDQPFRNALGEYISYLLLIVESTDWRVQISSEYPDGEDAMASIECIYGRRLANLRLCKDFPTLKPEQQRHTLVHEILHIVTDACDNVIQNADLPAVLGRPAYTILNATWRTQVEYLTDTLAYAIDELLDGRTKHDRLWENVLRAERGELPIPDPDTIVIPAA